MGFVMITPFHLKYLSNFNTAYIQPVLSPLFMCVFNIRGAVSCVLRMKEECGGGEREYN